MRYVINVDPRIKIPDDIKGKFWDLPGYVAFVGSFTEESCKKFVENLEAAENAARRAGQEILPVTINSYGGVMYAARGVIDAMNNCKIPIATIVESKAMSCGAWMFTCGAEGHRYITPGATIMIHPCTTATHAKIDEVVVKAEEGVRLNEIMLREMSVNCGHNETYFFDHLKNADHPNADWYIDGDEALKHNIANHVGGPTMTINVDLSHSFGLDNGK